MLVDLLFVSDHEVLNVIQFLFKGISNVIKSDLGFSMKKFNFSRDFFVFSCNIEGIRLSQM